MTQLLTVAACVLVVAALLALAARALNADTTKADGAPGLPYYKKPLLSAAERSFYGVLNQAAAGQWVVLAKIRLWDFIDVAKGVEDRQAHVNRISSKHVDFVLCRPDTLEVELVIELDDSSHARGQQPGTDDFKQAILDAAGVPLLRVPVRKTFSPGRLQQSINEQLKPRAAEAGN